MGCFDEPLSQKIPKTEILGQKSFCPVIRYWLFFNVVPEMVTEKNDSLSCLVTLYVINIDNNAMDGDDKVAQIAGLGQIIATKGG